MRIYKSLPHPDFDAERFNQYLRDNNKVILELGNWIVIKNSYIKSQLVIFSLKPKKYFGEINVADLVVLQLIIDKYKDKHIYINSDKNKSVANRLHLHVKI